MVIENITGLDFSALAGRASSLITLFQAIGGLIIAYLVFSIINMFLNRRKAKDIERMRQILESINKKLDKKK